MSFPIRVLLVEDDPVAAERLAAACLEAVGERAEVRVATDAEEAAEALGGGELDLIVHDLALPGHGVALFRAISERHPGVPVIVITAPDDPNALAELLDAGRRADLFGTDVEEAMVSYRPGADLAAGVEALAAMLRRYAEVAALPVALPAGNELSVSEKRAIQVFARRTGAARASAAPLGGGLSGAKTLIVDAEDEGGMRTAHVVAKLAGVRSIPGAVDGYENATPDLPAGLGAALAGVITAGAGDTGAVFFRLAEDFSRSWFECLGSSPSDAAASVRRLHERLADRYADAPVEARSVRELRADVVADDDFGAAGVHAPDLGELAERTVEIARGLQHRDLHGLNVLVSDTNEPLLIDYDNYAPANCALDPVTLELSAIFHRDEGAQAARRGWPAPEQAARWHELDAYLDRCPYPEAIRACRAWAEDAAGSPEEVSATLLAVAQRQLCFENTDKELARALAEAGTKALS